MRNLWNIINQLKLEKIEKIKLYLLLVTMLHLLLGGMVWLLIGRWFLPGLDWLACFMGYPAGIFGFLGGLFYLFNHDFA